MNAWPLWIARPNMAACANHPHDEPDLHRKGVTWRELGIPLDPEKVSLTEKA